MRGIECVEQKLAPVKERFGVAVGGLALVTEHYHPLVNQIALTREQFRFIGTKVALPATVALAIFISGLGVDQENNIVSAGPRIPPPIVVTATRTPTPFIITATPEPTPTPTFSPTPDIPATIRAIIGTPLPTPRPEQPPIIVIPPQPAPQPQPQPAPRTDVVIVRPEAIKPEVVKPEVVKVPEIMRVEVPVQATPHPDWISLTRKEFNTLTDEIADKKAAEARQKAEAEAKEARAAQEAARKAETEARVAAAAARAWNFDLLSALIGGVVGLSLGSAIVYTSRRRIIEYIHHHYPHPPLAP